VFRRARKRRLAARARVGVRGREREMCMHIHARLTTDTSKSRASSVCQITGCPHALRSARLQRESAAICAGREGPPESHNRTATAATTHLSRLKEGRDAERELLGQLLQLRRRLAAAAAAASAARRPTRPGSVLHIDYHCVCGHGAARAKRQVATHQSLRVRERSPALAPAARAPRAREQRGKTLPATGAPLGQSARIQADQYGGRRRGSDDGRDRGAAERWGRAHSAASRASAHSIRILSPAHANSRTRRLLTLLASRISPCMFWRVAQPTSNLARARPPTAWWRF
jgi:hypothetical protein